MPKHEQCRSLCASWDDQALSLIVASSPSCLQATSGRHSYCCRRLSTVHMTMLIHLKHLTMTFSQITSKVHAFTLELGHAGMPACMAKTLEEACCHIVKDMWHNKVLMPTEANALQERSRGSRHCVGGRFQNSTSRHGRRC